MTEEAFDDRTAVGDSLYVEVKGPDPQAWGDPGDRPAAAGGDAGAEPLAIGEIRDEGTPEEVKGPGEEWRGRHAED